MPRRAPPPTFEAALAAWQEGMSNIARLYGVSPLAGRLWALLFVATEPTSLEDLCTASGAAKSSVSVALRGLVHARVARRLPPRGDRRDYYEAIIDPWQTLADWNQLFFQREIAMFRENAVRIERSLAARGAPAGARAAELRRRIAMMRDFCEAFEELFGRFERARPAPRAARVIPIQIDDDDEDER